MKNEKIVSAFDAVELPKETSERIYSEIVFAERKKRHTVSKRFAAVLTAAIITVLAAGTVLAEVVIPRIISVKEEQTKVTPDGEIITETIEYDVYDAEPEVPYDYDWLVENSSFTKLAIESDAPYCAGFYGLNERADGDYEKLETLVSSSSVLRLPGYISEGFELKDSHINLYLTKEDAADAVKVSDTFVSEGVIYQCYQMPDSITDNIGYIGAVFSNGSGEEISITASLSETLTDGIGAKPDVKVSFAEIDGFEKVICLTDSKQNYCMAYRCIEPIENIAFDNIGNEERAAMHGVEVLSFGDSELCVEEYSVSSETVCMEELLKILESLA